MSYKWIPAEASASSAGEHPPAVPAEASETVEAEAKEEEEEGREYKEEKEEEPDWEDEDQSWGGWQPELAKPVPVPSEQDRATRSRSPRTTHRNIPLLRRAGDKPLVLKQRQEERPESPVRKKPPRSAIWYGYYDKAPEGQEAIGEKETRLEPKEPKSPPTPWRRGGLVSQEVPSARSVSATPQDPSRPTLTELKDPIRALKGKECSWAARLRRSVQLLQRLQRDHWM